MQFEISICIPTYNREAYLKQALDSIIRQLTPETKGKIEICVSDNASADNTKKLIEEYKNLYPHITYFRSDINMGADRNYLKASEIANGKYCWFLGSDDIINAGALSSMLKEINTDDDIYLFNRTECNIAMIPFKERKFLSKSTTTRTFEFGTPEKMKIYLDSCTVLGSLFSYLSSIVVKKTKWDAIDYDESFTGTAYSHVFMLVSILTKSATLKYIDKSFVSCRLGVEDSFASNIVDRIMLDINGYKKIFNSLLYDIEKKELYFKKIMQNNHTLFAILNLISDPRRNMDSKNKKDVLACFEPEVYSRLTMQTVYILSFPYKYLKKIYKLLKKF
jgi:Glycosyltransferases involved in cell wall biogenesis